MLKNDIIWEFDIEEKPKIDLYLVKDNQFNNYCLINKKMDLIFDGIDNNDLKMKRLSPHKRDELIKRRIDKKEFEDLIENVFYLTIDNKLISFYYKDVSDLFDINRFGVIDIFIKMCQVKIKKIINAISHFISFVIDDLSRLY